MRARSAVALHACSFSLGNATGPVVVSLGTRLVGTPATLIIPGPA